MLAAAQRRIALSGLTLLLCWPPASALSTQTERLDASTAAEANERIYWKARRAADTLWRARKPGAADGTMLAVEGYPYLRFWDLYTPDYSCPSLRERVGTVGDGGKWLCGVESLLQRPGCVVYSVGSNGEPSFEKDLLERTSCAVHTLDHTMDAGKVAAVELVPGTKLHAWGLVGESKKNPAEANLRTLSEVMAQLDHQWVDVLKMDVEGHEWALFEDWYREDNRTLPVTQLLVEFHFAGAANGLEATVAPVFDKLSHDGYRVFAVEPNYYCNKGCCASDLVEFAFIKTTRSGQVITGRTHGSHTHRLTTLAA